MKKAKHTPGPWFIWREEALKKEGLEGAELTEELLDTIDHSIYAGKPKELSRGHMKGKIQHIATLDDFDNEDKKEAKEALANARLIAAAPDLLSALKDIVKQFKKTAFPVGCDLADSIRVFGEAAIAKAEGKEVA